MRKFRPKDGTFEAPRTSAEGMSMNRRREIQLTPEEQAAFFRKHRKAALATIDKDGFPHVVAMNFSSRMAPST
jgi:hypothetical protein